MCFLAKIGNAQRILALHYAEGFLFLAMIIPNIR